MALGSMADKPSEGADVQLNARTGRPIRERREVVRSGFVNTLRSLELVVAPELVPDPDSEVDDPTVVVGSRKGKRNPRKGKGITMRPFKALSKRLPFRPSPKPIAPLMEIDEPITFHPNVQKPVVTMVSYTAGLDSIVIPWPSIKLAINIPAGQRFPILVDFNMRKLREYIDKGNAYRLSTTDQWAILNAEFGSTMKQDYLLSLESLKDAAGIRTEVRKNGSVVVDVDGLNHIASLNKGFPLVDPKVVIHARGRVAEGGPIGFLDLPPEIRNEIYKMLFVTETRRIRFCGLGDIQNCGGREVAVRHSGAFLRTCQQINQEGCAVLYGANEYIFERSYSLRGRWFDVNWKQVGYEDVERFLTTIGVYNLSCIRSVIFYLEDGNLDPAHEWTLNDRRFVYDANLLHCFQIIGTRCEKLEALEIFLNPRRKVCAKDTMFIESLKCIRNLECLTFRDRHPYIATQRFPFKIDEAVVKELQRAMLCARSQLDIVGLITNEREQEMLESRARYDKAAYEELFGPKNWDVPYDF
ncbi:MAG: hypothetical protein M1839_000094 [Geoglossum umbratile]|nr:MAG: hypothetical protein M1839_000094 [Geoglossum umbratile]